jgi:1-phosphofructokinase
MLITVNLNPCVDRTLWIKSFTRGGMNRVTGLRDDVAGKGINVSAALKALGIGSVCMGINYRDNGRAVDEWLDREGIPHDFVYAEGAVRTNIKLTEEDAGIMTEINQPGNFVPESLVNEMIVKIAANKPDMLVLSGSRPKGVGADIYKKISDACGCGVLLDAEGEALTLGMAAKKPPLVIKPNLFELETAFGVKLPSVKDIAEFCAGIVKKGIKRVCVSMGKDGALLIGNEGAYFSPAVDIEAKGVQGAGDSMVAGIVYALTKGLPPEEILKSAMAAAAASVSREGTLMCTKEGFEEMYKRVTVERIS